MEQYEWSQTVPPMKLPFRHLFKRKRLLVFALITAAFSICFLLNNAWTYDGPHIANFSSFQNLNNHAHSSTCSKKASRRGPHQRVISFSFFGRIKSRRGYFEGIEINANLIRELYPNWIMRLYHDIRKGRLNTTLDRLELSYGETLDLCFVGNIPGYGNLIGSPQTMWRFLTLTDPLVDISLFRDLDSNLNDREVLAVREWLEMTYPLHVMRDNPFHSMPILAGMWGARLDLGHRYLWKNVTDQMMAANAKALYIGEDQEALKQFVWPLAEIKGFLLQHDSYFCGNKVYKLAGDSRPFPSCRDAKRGLNFIGSRRRVDRTPMLKECPELCRLKSECLYC
ncbi:uncharacterized protein LOC132194342 isoform X2 [Neocloeon triangulifer]|nr:uncharacterized protein LOC132194342 isoform X2 [Neocloeon triangulifer]